ncbi:unnamed protein product [Lactuca virosa]|uniref:Uncharacterized protein n=1 Tax=Lactuca virosa TaxID=75947 RepID=A0AAU9ML21_9ASTR|nr:unnamed protein product [Lactuca virosa]
MHTFVSLHRRFPTPVPAHFRRPTVPDLRLLLLLSLSLTTTDLLIPPPSLPPAVIIAHHRRRSVAPQLSLHHTTTVAAPHHHQRHPRSCRRHTGGSIGFEEHRLKLKQLTGEDPSFIDLYYKTHLTAESKKIYFGGDKEAPVDFVNETSRVAIIRII